MEREINIASTSDTQAECNQAAYASSEDLAAGQLPELEDEGPNYSQQELNDMARSHAERLAAELEIHPERAEGLAAVGEEWVPEILLLEQPNSANCALHLAEHPEELRRLQALWQVSPLRARNWLGTLSRRLGADGESYRAYQQQREKDERRRRRDR